MASSLHIIILGLAGLSVAQDCAIGSLCKNALGTETCTPCPTGTACTQFTTSSGSLGAFYCQYTVCLTESASCAGRVGTCCGGLECGKASGATIRTCNAPATTSTTTTTTTTTTTATTTTTTKECGIGSQCKNLAGTETCSSCPTDTACTQFTTSSGSLGAFYCQYTVCLAESASCGGRVGTCCSGLECGKATSDAPIRTCNAPATTTTTTTTTPSTTTTTINIVVVTTPTTTTPTTTTPTTTTEASCLTVGGAKIGLPCVFPFTNYGVTYNFCTSAGGFDKPWCSTATDNQGNHLLGNWGDCNPACQRQQIASTASPATCNTVSGEDAGKKCVFPFSHQGVVHRACTYAGGFSKPWCSTRVNYWGHHREGYWGDCDMAACKVESQYNHNNHNNYYNNHNKYNH